MQLNLRSYRALFTVLFSFGFISLAQSFAGATDDWPQFLGPTAESTANGAKPLIEWKSENHVWVTDIPGTGWSSPVFSDGRIWLTTSVTTQASKDQLAKKHKKNRFDRGKTGANTVDLRAICVDLESGKILHDQSLTVVQDPDLINPLNSYASPTPVISDGKVVCHFGSYGTWCLDAKSGKPLWNTSFVVDHSVGPGSSPIVHNNKVLLVCDGIDKQFVVAVDLETGKEVWKTSRPPMRATEGEYQKAYCTPLMLDVDGKTQAIIPTAQWIVSYDPDTGEEIWRADHGSGFSVTPMPTYESGLVIFSTGFMRPEFVAVDPSGTGDVSKTHIKWRAKNAPTMPSFVSLDGKIFSISDRGILNCIDAKTGETIERKRIGGNFSATPLLAAGNLYLPSREGVMTIVKCDESLSKIATNQFDSDLMASPAVVGDDLIVRTAKKLYRIGKK